MSIANVPHDHAASGKSLWMALRFTLRKGGRGGTGRLWCRYVVASAVDELFVMEWVGEVKLWSGSTIVQKFGDR